MRKTFVKTLENLAEKDKNLFILTGDLGNFFKSFAEKFSDRFINCGVSEENMIGVAAGLALSGKNVYCYSIVPFLTMRALEKIRVDICYHNLNVKLLGAGGGLLYGIEGMTHHSIEDIAVMRSLPNMTVVAPADLQEAELLAKESLDFKGPLYIRLGRDNQLAVHETTPNATPNFKIGKGILIKKGENIALISCGTLVYETKKAAEILEKKGIKVSLVSLPTLKPLDNELIKNLSENHKFIFTIEDHNYIGGLGDAVLDILNNLSFRGVFKKIALPDEYSKYIGSVDYLYKKYGLDSESIAEFVLKETKNI